MTILSIVLAFFLGVAIYIILRLNHHCEQLENKICELFDLIEDENYQKLHEIVSDEDYF